MQSLAAVPDQPVQVGLNAVAMSVMTWYCLTAVMRAIGRKIPSGKLGIKVRDTMVDVITLVFAWQTALALTGIPLFRAAIDFLRRGSVEVAAASGYKFTWGLIVGFIFFGLAIWQGITFAKNDDKRRAWKHLVWFGLFLLVAMPMIPRINEFFEWLQPEVAERIARMVATGINFVCENPKGL